MSRVFFATTPIYYVNAEPHIGHTYTTVAVDTLARYHRLCGERTFFLTGTDEHGEKIAEAAEQRGITPQQVANQYSEAFCATWRQLGFSFDRFIRTTDPDHVRVVQGILQKLWDQGEIDFREYEGLYCVGCERFLTERDMENGLCRDHERAPERRREANYFFQMSRYFGWLTEHIEKHPDFIRPERYRNEALGMLRDASGLGDLCISRPKSRLEWGIELPFDRGFVCYVWFDALVNYLTGIGYPDGADFALAVGRRRAFHRQGHPEAPRDLLAGDAARARPPSLPPPERAWLLERRRAQGLEEPRQHDLAARDARALRLRRLPLLPAARDGLRPRREPSAKTRSSRASTPTSRTISATS